MKKPVIISSILIAVYFVVFFIIFSESTYTEEIQPIDPAISIETVDGIELSIESVELIGVRNKITYRKSCVIYSRVSNNTGVRLDAVKVDIIGYYNGKKIFSLTNQKILKKTLEDGEIRLGIAISDPFEQESIDTITIKAYR